MYIAVLSMYIKQHSYNRAAINSTLQTDHALNVKLYSNGPYTTGFAILHNFYLMTTALSASEMSYSYTKHTARNTQFPLQCSHNKLTIMPQYFKSHCTYTEMSFKKRYLTQTSLLVTAVEISFIPHGYNMVHYM